MSQEYLRCMSDIIWDKSGTKRDHQEPKGVPGYGVTVHM